MDGFRSFLLYRKVRLKMQKHCVRSFTIFCAREEHSVCILWGKLIY